MFDSPFDLCPRCGEMVLLDQTQLECAREHLCPEGPCPLSRCFAEPDSRVPQPVEPNAHAKR